MGVVGSNPTGGLFFITKNLSDQAFIVRVCVWQKRPFFSWKIEGLFL
ncbi:hypothetical protein RV04_GL001555 [Enterococcus hermanniensis]|uniref:Uncharacterized protein n=1 Tax=Enterococcus hermanniensis TaxID=249189 RepID=A0A1L8TN97_9ENTE|nr:hypothetical protein RV04_GL001555 [Enterococcus hermanniensis]